MKTKILTLLLTTFSFTCFAQGFNFQIIAQPQSKMINGNFNVPNSDGATYLPMDKKFGIGFEGGVAVGYNFNQNVCLSMGMLYSIQGQNYNDYAVTSGSDMATMTRSVAMDYLKIPIRVQFTSAASGVVSFTGFAGIYVAPLLSYEDRFTENISSSEVSGSTTIYYTLDASMTASGQAVAVMYSYAETGGVSTQGSATYTLSGKPYKTDFGAMLGAGVQFKISDKLALPLMLSYEAGLSDIKDHTVIRSYQGDSDLYWNFFSTDDRNAVEKYHNSALGILIGLTITL
jgi:opacity protein-like surface antigen